MDTVLNAKRDEIYKHGRKVHFKHFCCINFLIAGVLKKTILNFCTHNEQLNGKVDQEQNILDKDVCFPFISKHSV